MHLYKNIVFNNTYENWYFLAYFSQSTIKNLVLQENNWNLRY